MLFSCTYKFQAWDFWHCAFLLCFCCISWITPNLTILGASMWVTHGSSLYKKPASNMPQKILNYMLKWQISIIMMTDFHIEQHNIKRLLLFISKSFCIPFWRSKREARQWRFCKANTNTNKTKTNLNSFQLLFLSTTFSSYFLLLSCFCR